MELPNWAQQTANYD